MGDEKLWIHIKIEYLSQVNAQQDIPAEVSAFPKNLKLLTPIACPLQGRF